MKSNALLIALCWLTTGFASCSAQASGLSEAPEIATYRSILTRAGAKDAKGNWQVDETKLKQIKQWAKNQLGLPETCTIKISADTKTGSALVDNKATMYLLIGSEIAVGTRWEYFFAIETTWDFGPNVAKRVSLGKLPPITVQEAHRILSELSDKVGNKSLVLAGKLKDGRYFFITGKNQDKPSPNGFTITFGVTNMKAWIGMPGAFEQHEVKSGYYLRGGTITIDSDLGIFILPQVPVANSYKVTAVGGTYDPGINPEPALVDKRGKSISFIPF